MTAPAGRRIVQQCVEERPTSLHRLLLSGGTDSSTVAGMLTRAAPQAGQGIFDRLRGRRLRRDGICSHRCAHFGLEQREYYLTPDDLRFRDSERRGLVRSAVRQLSVLPA